MYKKIIKDSVADAAIDLAITFTGKGATIAKNKTVSYLKGQDYTNMRLTIKDIIDDAKIRAKADLRNCNSIDSDIDYYRCRKTVKGKRITELKKSIKYCKFNEDPKLCANRIMDEIRENQLAIIKYNNKMNELQLDDIYNKNARQNDRYTDYDIGYLPVED